LIGSDEPEAPLSPLEVESPPPYRDKPSWALKCRRSLAVSPSGPNGAEQTTLLKIIMDLLKPADRRLGRPFAEAHSPSPAVLGWEPTEGGVDWTSRRTRSMWCRMGSGELDLVFRAEATRARTAVRCLEGRRGGLCRSPDHCSSPADSSSGRYFWPASGPALLSTRRGHFASVDGYKQNQAIGLLGSQATGSYVVVIAWAP